LSFLHGIVKFVTGPDFSKLFLNPSTLNYSAGYWEKAETDEESQYANMKLISEKLHLRPGMRVLCIGTGYGSIEKTWRSNTGSRS
jgi:cyclopropane-fatty-acyl-phospholipid synthase